MSTFCDVHHMTTGHKTRVPVVPPPKNLQKNAYLSHALRRLESNRIESNRIELDIIDIFWNGFDLNVWHGVLLDLIERTSRFEPIRSESN